LEDFRRRGQQIRDDVLRQRVAAGGARPAAEQAAQLAQRQTRERLEGGVDEQQPPPPIQDEQRLGGVLEQPLPAEGAPWLLSPRSITLSPCHLVLGG